MGVGRTGLGTAGRIGWDVNGMGGKRLCNDCSVNEAVMPIHVP